MSSLSHTHFVHNAVQRSRARHWFFTENNPEGELDVLFDDLLSLGIIDYATWQLEVGDDGTEHMQGTKKFK